MPNLVPGPTWWMARPLAYNSSIIQSATGAWCKTCLPAIMMAGPHLYSMGLYRSSMFSCVYSLYDWWCPGCPHWIEFSNLSLLMESILLLHTSVTSVELWWIRSFFCSDVTVCFEKTTYFLISLLFLFWYMTLITSGWCCRHLVCASILTMVIVFLYGCRRG
jgi:hypothetical protein